MSVPDATPSIGVVICSYNRPDDLARCLAALRSQGRPIDDIVVAVREGDLATLDTVRRLAEPGGIRPALVREPGVIAARNVGLEACRCDIVSFIDDDTVVATDWAARIVAHFAADPGLGALGGRDRCHDGERFDDRERAPVGRIQWFGRPIGNHHLGFGAAREAEWLKSANMSVRRAAVASIRFDTRLRGSGAQPAEDLAFSLAIRKAGWRVLYDPAVSLDHYAARRDEQRHYVASDSFADPDGFYDFCYNNVIALWPYLSPARRGAHAVWSLLVGMSVRPGLAQVPRLWPTQGRDAWRRFIIAQAAQRDASLMMWRTRPRPRASATMVSAASS